MTALAYFGPQFFKLLVGSGSRDLLITGLFGAEKFVTVGIYILFFADWWGRKPTLWISAVLMAICFMIVTVRSSLDGKKHEYFSDPPMYVRDRSSTRLLLRRSVDIRLQQVLLLLQ